MWFATFRGLSPLRFIISGAVPTMEGGAAMGKATVSLLAAAETAAKANAGSRAVSIVPHLQGGHAVAEVTLLQGTSFRKITQKLD